MLVRENGLEIRKDDSWQVGVGRLLIRISQPLGCARNLGAGTATLVNLRPGPQSKGRDSFATIRT